MMGALGLRFWWSCHQILVLALIMEPVVCNHAQQHNASNSKDCSTLNPACIRCNERGCVKCSELLRIDTRECLDDCPSGYVGQWSTSSEFMGRVCYPVGLSGSFMATVVGIAVGAVVCLVLIVGAMAVIRRKQKRKKYRETFIDDNIDRLEFYKQLDELRPQAEYFLQMLNDTRRQIRKLHLAGDSSGAATYHPVVRDLAKILILLNKPVELISCPPHDWQRLYVWAEKVLDRYKPELTQLIEFLQQPSIPPSTSDPRLGTSEHSTFKAKFSTMLCDDHSPTLSAKNQRNLLQPESASLGGHQEPQNQQNHFLGSLISLHEFDERSSSSHHDTSGNSSNPFGDTFDHVRSYLSTSGINDSSLWLQDEFFKLGFRPQDEITTEL
ncbi:uncharacterized protein LOC129744084 [Uranotaenia lowii]|uniref:uncharacterized protein LOC129744084 n=1 Tax=Uranotaenia lowii TaxID=190385 RepID=UPI00247A86DA|nr:uncharacterized protein LOC129744084 [Uranotaenia lowii]XP_055592426.1 uncharacterized protein LOC129744084 [Uranotaenia lowii]XP_055592433.1 uncharacterized protein LOC129744084 [Uranotaenia lowii]XP_055592438.1 uncharacterized protein LOC129744084 [Uranotaenia lowii]XP_055592448.1 uncharacterized protein LOC129744084 [Uranotaenia lowii]XP_055592457.1 uncharacterized protein LOC129744084 [Uranotaenia lowii]XP_055592463.1 uncharacterized protein LOC129744084 [Uranotaenia lowii]